MLLFSGALPVDRRSQARADASWSLARGSSAREGAKIRQREGSAVIQPQWRVLKGHDFSRAESTVTKSRCHPEAKPKVLQLLLGLSSELRARIRGSLLPLALRPLDRKLGNLRRLGHVGTVPHSSAELAESGR